MVCEYRGRTLRVELSRQQFEEATQDLLDRTRFTAVQALKAAGMDWPDLDRVLLVGGSTRMPMVREMLQQVSGKAPDASVAADEAVAHGAALRAGLVLAQREGRQPSFSIQNVNSHSLGVVGIDPLTRRKRNGILIPRNTRLPVTAKRVFHTSKVNQRSILVQIVEGEERLGRRLQPDRPLLGPPFAPRSAGQVAGEGPLPLSGGRPVEGPRRRAQHRPPGRDGDRPRERPEQEHMDAWRKRITGLEPTERR